MLHLLMSIIYGCVCVCFPSFHCEMAAIANEIQRWTEKNDRVRMRKRFAVCCYYGFECQCHKLCVAVVVTLATFWYMHSIHICISPTRMGSSWTKVRWTLNVAHIIFRWDRNSIQLKSYCVFIMPEILLITHRGSKSMRFELDRMKSKCIWI